MSATALLPAGRFHAAASYCIPTRALSWHAIFEEGKGASYCLLLRALLSWRHATLTFLPRSAAQNTPAHGSETDQGTCIRGKVNRSCQSKSRQSTTTRLALLNVDFFHTLRLEKLLDFEGGIRWVVRRCCTRPAQTCNKT